MYGPGATCSTWGAKRPTASAPAVAVSAVRHHASQVRSAAMDVRCQTSTCAGDSGSGSAMPSDPDRVPGALELGHRLEARERVAVRRRAADPLDRLGGELVDLLGALGIAG